ncbi:MAG: YggT family protein [Alphaproteobacteria bacterium]|jgi:YggT family protein|nr:YggT family protein [Alphaproteobacteria bacterium]OJU56639.1 MAG: hypothetical protein BGO00_10390 [Alphaproteobacteria bacterium 62-8]MBN9556394.1 YggT family protein [Alphaproteobacteria bacterium]MBN9568816.1 YggT family protein [Alphaproteobacteria bacterium]MBN9578898.1 YggT family protein [Alphaproteobacteria bacterium]
MVNPIIWLLLQIIEIYVWIIIASVIVSWLIAFNVINLRNNFVRAVVQALQALTEPVFRWVRRFLPPIAGLDISPLIVLIGLYFIRYSILWLAYRFAL